MINQEFKAKGTKYQLSPNFGICCRVLRDSKLQVSAPSVKYLINFQIYYRFWVLNGTTPYYGALSDPLGFVLKYRKLQLESGFARLKYLK